MGNGKEYKPRQAWSWGSILRTVSFAGLQLSKIRSCHAGIKLPRGLHVSLPLCPCIGRPPTPPANKPRSYKVTTSALFRKRLLSRWSSLVLPPDPPPSLLDSEETSSDVMGCPTEGSHDHMELRPEALLHPANRIGRSSDVAFPRRTSRGAVTQTNELLPRPGGG